MAVKSWVSSVKAGLEANTGLLLITLAQAFGSIMNVSVKKLSTLDQPVPTLQLVFLRMLITYCCGMAYMLYTKVPHPWLGPPEVRWLLLSRGFFGFFGLFGMYYSLQYLSLSDAVVLTFLTPMCTGIAGKVFLKEKYTMLQAIAGLMSLFGVVLIARPPFLFGKMNPYVDLVDVEDLDPSVVLPPAEVGTPEQRLIAVGVALLGVFGATGAFTSIRAIGKRAHALHMMSAFSVLCMVVSSVGMAATHEPIVIPTKISWGLLLLVIGACGFLSQIFITMGLQRETASRGTLAMYTQVVFASALDRIFFHSKPSALSFIGTLIIIASALWVAISKPSVPPPVVEEDVALEEGLLEHDERSKGWTEVDDESTTKSDVDSQHDTATS